MEISEKLLVEAIANYMVVEGTARTMTGNTHFSFEGVAAHFNMPVKRLLKLKDRIVSELESKAQVAQENGVWTGSDFDLMFYGNYCDVNMDD